MKIKKLPAQDVLEKLGLTEDELRVLDVAWDDEPDIDKKIDRLLEATKKC